MTDGNGHVPIATPAQPPEVTSRLSVIVLADGRVGLEIPPGMNDIAVYGLLTLALVDLYPQMRRQRAQESSRIVVPTPQVDLSRIKPS